MSASARSGDSTPRLEFLQWDTRLDPIAVALVAAHLDPEACSGKSGGIKSSDAHLARRQTIVCAVTLIRETQDVVTNGPNPKDIPREYFEQASNERFAKFKRDCETTSNLATPGKRLRARAKLVTGEPRSTRAEEYLIDFLKDYCEGGDKTDGGFKFSAVSRGGTILPEPSTPQQYVAALEAKDPPYELLFILLLRFLQWKRELKRSQASTAGKNGEWLEASISVSPRDL
ncbi:MAG TPA: hypothetical protein VFO40_16570 [Chthoniobacterales bacterium]|nr:hypothetical protein [Chthoniobacterales bacterium]